MAKRVLKTPLRHAKTMEHFIIVERGVLISHADVSERAITHRGETYLLCGIGEVMTNPNFRHEGHGQRVVSAATDYIRSSDADIGMLFTGTELEAFYNSTVGSRSTITPSPMAIPLSRNQTTSSS